MSSKHDDGGNGGGLRRKSPQGVLDLLPDANHDNVKLVVVGDVVATPLERQALTAKRQKMEANVDVVVDVHQQEPAESSSPGDEALEIVSKNLFPNTPMNQSKAEEDPTEDDDDADDNQNEDDDDEDAMMVVEHFSTKSPSSNLPVVTNTTRSSRKEEETTTDTRPTHLRQYCTATPFVPLPETRYMGNEEHANRFIPRWALCGTVQNAEYCGLCYCYVCDKPAKECQRWFSTEHPMTTTHNHCHATDKDMYRGTESIWRNLRVTYKCAIENDVSHLITDMETEAIDLAAILVDEHYLRKPRGLPKEWGDRVEPWNKCVTPYVERGFLWKCRKCGWYTKMGNKRTCYSCERIASDLCFSHCDAETSPLYQPKPFDVLLGNKTIPFRIQAHDPRKIKTCQEQWAKYEGTSPEWIYDEAEMEEDMFRLRLGPRPWLGSILATMQVMNTDKVPDDGSFKFWRKPSNDFFMNYEADDNGDEEEFDTDPDFAFYREETFNNACNFGFTDAILMDKNSRVIFEELCKHEADINGNGISHSRFAADVVATWNKEERRGEFNVRLFHRRVGVGSADMSALLGAWFGIFPFSLSDLVGSVRARSDVSLRTSLFSKLPFPDDEDGEEAFSSILESATEEMEESVENFNEDVETREDQLSLQSSLGNSCLLGGVCSSDTTFSGVMRRYITEMLPDYINAQDTKFKAVVSWFGQAAGVTAHHRAMSAADEQGGFEFRPSTFESCIPDEEVPIASENLVPECRLLASNTKSINALLVHLENLGHEEAPFVEGLNVELLPFQRQTLQWALDREQIPGGLQSFLWTKLPHVEDENVPDLYYNLLLQKITTEKPKLVRGGIIAEEMGLGKTVISLALILQNPAPTEPASGSKSESLSSDATATSVDCVGWDHKWKSGEGQSPLKGSIISRGTLVVCHVSLVGQWIEEAKRRLQNPGLVYAYHGQNRKRDAIILAQNSIIVTTYATLAKDATYHANKAANNGVSDYCPPCEQIRWWRIICDESHALKQETTQTKAVMSLVGDHKWAVSGTPWNTSLLDVKNQLKFVGLECVDSMFAMFYDSVIKHVTNRRIRNSRYDSDNDNSPKFGQFMFLMRAAMIRHAQNQQYRGTSTTLMSLPPKTERSILIEFQGQEIVEYEKLAQEALLEYQAFRAEHWKKLSSHYLTLTQKLVPLRIACSGGRVPFNEKSDENASSNPNKKKKVQVFSEFSFRTKFDVLMNLLKRIRDNEPDSKSLVFSQYTSSLKFLQEELPKHGFQFRTLSGDMSLRQRAEALHAFQHDPPTTIFLLSMRAGAVGINLTQANRVFLLEPAMNPSLEAQAIGRVHRLGQTRKVKIVRLMMKDSIETKISQLVQSKYSSTLSTTEKKDATTGLHVPDANAPIVGNMRTDKTAILTGEFDFLFGMTRSLDDQHQDGVMWHGDSHDQDEEMTSGDDESEDDDSSDSESDAPNGMASGMI